MGKISEHYKREEFQCKCNCGFNAVDFELLEVMEKIRKYWGRPVLVHCADRCLQHNRSVGSKDTSKHVRGLACDFHIEEISHINVYNHLEKMFHDKYGIGVYDWGVHIDVRPDKARWDERTEKN